MKKLLIIVLISILFNACTKNARTRSFGGKEIYELQPNEILINATWKQDNLWVLTKDTINNKFHFREKSSFGLLNGEVEFK